MGHRILVVDDEAHILQVLQLKLRNAGFDVLTAIDGEEAMEVAVSALPDLVITDFSMPYRNGLEFARMLHEHSATGHIPIIMLTARGYALDDAEIARTNIRQVMSKPFGPRDVLRQVTALLNGEGGQVEAA